MLMAIAATGITGCGIELPETDICLPAPPSASTASDYHCIGWCRGRLYLTGEARELACWCVETSTKTLQLDYAF